jgi:pseudaminic acid biosynthesis-associated methylase
MATEQLNSIWKNQFGVEYTRRKSGVHETEGGKRRAFWHQLVEQIPDAVSYLEIGCNAGMNLEGLYNANPGLQITGLEPNTYALSEARHRSEDRYEIVEGNIFDIDPLPLRADLVFTCTVLIHIHPGDLYRAMEQIYAASGRYILTMEYYWPTLKEIEYRGLNNALWKRDFGAFWLQHFNVHALETGYLDARDGFDRTTWWLFEKPKHTS